MIRSFFLFLALFLSLESSAHAWWNKEWTARKKITVDTTAATGSEITSPIGGATVLLRLHDGNFAFGSAAEGGADLRFVTEDDKTVLPSQIEKYDGLLNEAFVWVKLPDVKPGAQTSIWLYFGNAEAKPEKDAKPPFDGDTALVYHFAEKGAAPVDSSGQKNTAETPSTPSEGAIIGAGARLLGTTPITIPASPTLALKAGDSLTWSAWIKQTIAQADAVLFNRGAFTVGATNGSPYVLIGSQRVVAAEPVPLNTWAHVAVVARDQTVTLFVNGKSAGSLNAALPALDGPATLGAGTGGTPGFIGEIDEVEVARAARTEGAVQFAARSQGGGAVADKLLQFGEDEASSGGKENELTKHLSLLGEISKSLTVDGWVVIFLCAVLALVGWAVAIQKLVYLNAIKKGTDEFMTRWRHVASDLTALDHHDAESVKSLGGTASPKIQRFMRQSLIYKIYHIGAEEIRDRMARGKEGEFKGLSGRSIQAIRASLDTGMVEGTQKLNSNLVFLTIGIAGGPYLGLLGTVIGVMITFAVIAQSGEVEINSIAPGIAGALLATVAGLAVAIPALFIYSYLNARIKDTIANMHTFIDEFITKMAESYPTGND